MTAFEFNTRLIDLNDYIRGFAMKYTRDETLAEDLAQETILKALSNREKFRTNTNLKGWLKVILKNTFINSYRKKSNQMISYNSEDYQVMTGEADTYAPDNIMMTKHVNKIIDGLSPDLSIPFRLHFEGFKYQEIADKMSLPIGTVKSRIHQARKVLSSVIENG
ncbi:MAG: sigma-70 family RNA polymerase sigma factor [Crocinitomicaceae bacterium]